MLWYGPGPDAETQRDVLEIVIPAALQAVQQTFRSLSGVPGILLRGFESARVPEFFTNFFPDTPVLAPGAATNGAEPLIVHRDVRTLARDTSIKDPASVIVLEQQLDLYRITTAKVDLAGI